MKRIFKHVLRHRELYLFVPLSIGMCLMAIAGVTSLTGRAVVDDPGAIVGWLYSFIKAILIIVLTGQTQEHLFGFRSDRKTLAASENQPLHDDIYDACVTSGLLIFFAYLLQH